MSAPKHLSIQEREADVRKATIMSVLINAVQIILVAALAIRLIFFPTLTADRGLLIPEVIAAVLAVMLGAVTDIQQTLTSGKLLRRQDAMDETIDSMETLNRALRVQRHDFLNHLQVVYSLMEMQEYEEANAYIEKVYGDIQNLGRALKTASPAINALLNVKMAAAEERGISVKTDIRSAWKDLPVPAWELCKVLGNLIDNAMDAMKDTREPSLSICLSEELRGYRFTVENSGPDIPAEALESIFRPGFSSKGEGRGMGLYIVRQTLQGFGGDIDVTSGGGRTAFTGFIPKEKPAAPLKEAKTAKTAPDTVPEVPEDIPFTFNA